MKSNMVAYSNGKRGASSLGGKVRRLYEILNIGGLIR